MAKRTIKRKRGTRRSTLGVGIICLAFGGCLLAGDLIQRFHMPDEEKLARSAVYLENAEVLPENEGKLVIVTGTVMQTGDTVDEITGLSFDVPVVYRVVEKYELDTRYAVSEWNWTRHFSNASGDLDCDYVCGEATVGDFVLTDEILQQFPMETIYSRYQESELEEMGLTTQQDGDTVYLAADGDDATAWNHSTLLGLLSNGDTRISYEYYDTSVEPEVTMIGYQTGNTLTLTSADEISFPDVMAGKLTQEEFIAAGLDETSGSSLWAVILVIAIWALGIYWIGSDIARKRAARG